MAFIYDREGRFPARANPESIVWQRVASSHWEAVLKELVAAHASATDSKHSRGLIEDWDRIVGDFWQVCPKEMLTRLPHPLDDEASALVAAE